MSDKFIYLRPDGSQGAKEVTVGSIAGNFFVDNRTISLAEATAKQIELEVIPAEPNDVIVDIVGGTSQRVGVDFVVVGKILSWDGYGMETIISEGDKIRVTFTV